MKEEYDLDKMKSRPNPFAKQLKQQVTLPLGIDVIEYFEAMVQEHRTSQTFISEMAHRYADIFESAEMSIGMTQSSY